MASNSNQLSYRQLEQLRQLVRHPHGYFGSCTNATMNALQRRGLVSLDWSGEWPYRTSTWVVTDAGREVAAPQPLAQRGDANGD